MEKTAIVILNWNGKKMLERFLPGVLRYSRDEAVVYVSDNASTDGSLDMLEKDFPEVRIIALDRNYGFAEGYNKTLKQLDYEYYVLLNSDVEVAHGWLTPLTEFMDNHPEVAACQPKLLSERDKDVFEYAGAAGGFIDCYGYPFCRGRMFDMVESDNGQYDYRMEIQWATGACMMIRAADFAKAGGFDGRFFAHNEEIDLCWRLRIMGRKVYCVPDSEVYHVGGGTLPKNNPMKTYLNFRNNLTMLYKNLPEATLCKVMRMRFVLDYVAAVQALVSWRLGDFKAIIKGRRDFNRRKSEYKEIRKMIQDSRVADCGNDLCDVSILWSYYVKGKKLFSDLPLLWLNRQ